VESTEGQISLPSGQRAAHAGRKTFLKNSKSPPDPNKYRAAPATQAVSCILRTPDGFSWNHNSANTECVSARISLGVLFYIAKKFSSQHLGG